MKPLTIVGIIVIVYIVGQFLFTFYHYKLGVSLSKHTFTGKKELGDANNPTLSLFIHGDSVGAGVGATSFDTSVAGRVAKELSKKNYVHLENNAASGNKVHDLLEQAPTKRKDLIILIVSSNDLFRFTPQALFKANVEELLRQYSKQATKLVIVGPGHVDTTTAIPLVARPLYAVQGKKYSEIITEAAKQYDNVVHISPFFPPPLDQYGPDEAHDGFHPNDEGHRYWKDMVMAGINS